MVEGLGFQSLFASGMGEVVGHLKGDNVIFLGAERGGSGKGSSAFILKPYKPPNANPP